MVLVDIKPLLLEKLKLVEILSDKQDYFLRYSNRNGLRKYGKPAELTDLFLWDSPLAFENADACTGGADDYLRLLILDIIPKGITGVPRRQGIAGYSLADYPVCNLSDEFVFPCGLHVWHSGFLE